MVGVASCTVYALIRSQLLLVPRFCVLLIVYHVFIIYRSCCGRNLRVHSAILKQFICIGAVDLGEQNAKEHNDIH
jgi:hypothetical protein